MSTPGTAFEDNLAGLGHKLRTPLTHIIGYSGLLLENEDVSPETRQSVQSVHSQADVILARIEHWLAPQREGASDEKVAALQADIAEPLHLIIGNVGGLVQRLSGAALLDALRIARACTELLTFVQQEGAIAVPARLGSALPPPDAAAKPGHDSGKENASPEPARVLVIDDNAGNRDMLSRQLVHYGHQAVCAESGAEGLAALQEKRFELVLLDVMMPVLSGVEVLRQIRAMPLLAGLPVIMISALDEVESAARCIEMGADEYLVKPFDPVLLRARLHSALERKRLQEEQRERTRELEQATQDLQRANEDLQSFASAASHDLQEPLRTVSTTLEYFNLQWGGDLTGEQRELFRLAVDGARRMSHLISDLLAYSMAGGEDEELEPVACETALLEALTNLRQSIRESGARITHSDLPVVMAKPGHLVQLFQNLVGNAIKYRGEERPDIRIRASSEGTEWIVSVRDNGIGIEEKYQRRIFQPFGRLHGSDRPGSGLGLAICER
ncbi:MAG: response regulator, partial [Acidobacteriota bacterium]